MTSGQSDNDTNNLFVGDHVCFNNPDSGTTDGCQGQTTYTVNATNTNGSQFNTSSNVSAAMTIGTGLVASQSGRITVTFKPTTLVPAGGYLRLTITAASSSYNDGIPDSGGFDSGELGYDGPSLLSGSSPQNPSATCLTNGCISASGFTISTATITSTAPTGYHTVLIGVGSTLAQGVQYSFTLGHATEPTLRFINPSPSGVTHQRGISDSIAITLQSEDSTNNILDKTQMKVNPVDGVFVSANVELSLSYTISGRTSPAVGCGKTSVQSSTATAVPFGSISSCSFSV